MCSSDLLEKVTGDEAGYSDKSDMEHQTTASDNNNH